MTDNEPVLHEYVIVDMGAYERAVEIVKAMTPQELLVYLDDHYGRSGLPRSCTVDDIRNEALTQTERKFGPDYERFQMNRRTAFTSALVPQRHATEADADAKK